MKVSLKDGRVIYLENRSAAEADDACGMKYWWSQLAGGIGLMPNEEALPLRIGGEVHEDFAQVAALEELSEANLQAMCDEITVELGEQQKRDTVKMEQVWRRLGWLAAYGLYLEPKIRAEYEHVSIEREIVLERGDLWVAVTPDRILRHRKSGFLVYREYKSTISASQKWIDSWKYAVQLHSSIAAVQEELKTPVRFAQVMGLMKGDIRQGKLSHPYVWAWHNPATNEWTHEYDKARGANWISMPVWEFPGGIVEWVKKCGPEVAMAQFPHTEPIFLNARLLQSWVDRRRERQKEIANVLELCENNRRQRKLHFEQRTKQCIPAFGDKCPYLPLCWNPVAEDNYMSHPDFKRREPHHELEKVMRAGKGEA